jgi:hypothetical protein
VTIVMGRSPCSILLPPPLREMPKDAAEMTNSFAGIRWERRTIRASHGRPHAAITVMTAALAVAHRAIQRARYGGVARLDR